MNLYLLPLVLVFFCLVNSFIAAKINDHVSIDCGSSDAYYAGSQLWHGDLHTKTSSLLQIKGSSTTSTVIHKLISVDHQLPYKTARISRSRFSYSFQVNPGQKILRLHFSPAPYKGFKGLKDLFFVEAGPFTLLGNFSASLTAIALGVNSFVKEYCLNIEENQEFSIVFVPASSHLLDTYAFVNGIEIISVPQSFSYFQKGDVDSSTALETIRRVNVKQYSVSSSDDDIGDVFGMWETHIKRKEKNITWKVSVDVGFRYLVRVRFSKLGFKMEEISGTVFSVHVNGISVNTKVETASGKGDENRIPLYSDNIVMMKGRKEEGKRDLLICLQSSDEFVDGREPLKGFEVMKLSNHDNSLVSPNPLPSALDSSSCGPIQTLVQVLGHRNVIASVAIALLALVNIIVYTLRYTWEASCIEEENKPSARAERRCRRFSLAEMRLATMNFSEAHLIGKGGFGKVYRGIIDNGQETVAIKRLKSNSKQGAREFLTEIETLTELRHVNLVSLIGYCNENGEMILVYEYMACGSLAHHLYKLTRNNNDSISSLNWKQLLNACIGAGRGLDYLHTGYSLIHRDVKASNILLDESFTAKVSDFGLAKHLIRSKLQSHVSTKVKGTFGYMDPYYLSTGKLTNKTDIYAFGVVLLEVLSGRPAWDLRVLEDERVLTKWAQENISKGKADRIVASSLRDEISEDSLKAFVGIAERCLDNDPKKRPTMAQVVLQLEFALEQQESSKSVVPNGMMTSDHVDDIEHETNVTGQPMLDFTNWHNVAPTFRDQTTNKVVNREPPPENKDGRKAIRHKPPHMKLLMHINPVMWYIRGRRKDTHLKIFSPMIEPEDLAFLEKGDGLASFDVIGRGGCGQVYKAVLPGSNGKEIAIKKIIEQPKSADKLIEEDNEILSRKMRQIKSEIQTMGLIRHRNLLPLLAHVSTPGGHYLVYEYMKNGSVEDYLRSVAEGRRELDWLTRYKIALGVAAGLEYLHMVLNPPIIHKDPKPSNVLLDDAMVARITDFGLAGCIPDGCTHISTLNVAGTVGYIAPEYCQTLKFSDRCDVYGFGVTLSVLVIGKLPSDEFFSYTDEMTLVKWTRNVMVSEDPKRAIDPKLLGNGYEEQMLLALKVACFCTLDNPRERPNMKDVRCMLSEIKH